MTTAADDPRAGLARRIFERTGDRQQVVDGMVGRGYSLDEATAAADRVAPPTPAPAGATPAPAGDGTPAKGSPSATSTPPSRGRARRAGRGLFSSAGRGRSPRPSLTLPRRPTAGDVSGFGFGVVLYVLALSYLKHGPDGPRGWIAAKFLNRPFVPTDGGALASPDGEAGPLAGGDELESTRPARPVGV